MPKYAYILTENEFRRKNLWITDDELGSTDRPRGWNSRGNMHKYLGKFLKYSDNPGINEVKFNTAFNKLIVVDSNSKWSFAISDYVDIEI